jgi:hypothetical protein
LSDDKACILLRPQNPGVTLDFARRGKPTDNAFIESFNGKFRAECLNAHWFMTLDEARRKCEAWGRSQATKRAILGLLFHDKMRGAENDAERAQ